VREYAAQKEIDEKGAWGVGMKEKAEEFVASGGEIYQRTIKNKPSNRRFGLIKTVTSSPIPLCSRYPERSFSI
jgi:hypothetical protein